MKEIKDGNMELSFSDFFEILRRFWYIILTVTLIFGALVFFFTRRQPKVYSLDAKFFVTVRDDYINDPANNITISSLVGGTAANTDFLCEYVVDGKIDELHDKYLVAINDKYKDVSSEQLRKYVSSSTSAYEKKEYNRYFVITVKCNDAVMCRDVLQAYINMFNDPSSELSGLEEQGIAIRCSNPNLTDGVQVGPSVVRNTVIAAFAAAVISYVVLFFISISNGVINSAEDLEKQYPDIPVLAVIPMIPERDSEISGNADKSVRAHRTVKKNTVETEN